MQLFGLGGQLLWLSLIIILEARAGTAVRGIIWWSALVSLMTSSAALYNLIFRMRFRSNKKQRRVASDRFPLREVGATH